MVYLDNAANAPVFPEVLEAMLPWLRPDHVGNPGSLHTQGVNAREAVENARRQVAKMIGADPSEVFFTSGGTESNNAWLQNFGGDLVLTTKIEHDSVLEPLAHRISVLHISILLLPATLRPIRMGVWIYMIWNSCWIAPIIQSAPFLSCG